MLKEFRFSYNLNDCVYIIVNSVCVFIKLLFPLCLQSLPPLIRHPAQTGPIGYPIYNEQFKGVIPPSAALLVG